MCCRVRVACLHALGRLSRSFCSRRQPAPPARGAGASAGGGNLISCPNACTRAGTCCGCLRQVMPACAAAATRCCLHTTELLQSCAPRASASRAASVERSCHCSRPRMNRPLQCVQGGLRHGRRIMCVRVCTSSAQRCRPANAAGASAFGFHEQVLGAASAPRGALVAHVLQCLLAPHPVTTLLPCAASNLQRPATQHSLPRAASALHRSYTEGVSDLHGVVTRARPPTLLWQEGGGGGSAAAGAECVAAVACAAAAYAGAMAADADAAGDAAVLGPQMLLLAMLLAAPARRRGSTACWLTEASATR